MASPPSAVRTKLSPDSTLLTDWVMALMLTLADNAFAAGLGGLSGSVFGLKRYVPWSSAIRFDSG
jgi:hypothetical protein